MKMYRHRFGHFLSTANPSCKFEAEFLAGAVKPAALPNIS
jgi:hypothetical protein